MEAIVDGVMGFESVNQLLGTLMTSTVTVLTGGDGCGKTMTGLMILEHARDIMKMRARWTTKEDFVATVEIGARRDRIVILDNFMGHIVLERYDEWREIIEQLRLCANDKTIHVLLITRTNILEEALRAYGAEISVVIRNNQVTLSTNYQTMFSELVEGLVRRLMIPPNFEELPDIGFPLFCALVPHVPDNMKSDLLLYPRNVLKNLFLSMINVSQVATCALGLLAVQDNYVNIYRLLYTDSYITVILGLSHMNPEEDVEAKILSFYQENPGFVLIEDELVSFVNEALKEAVLLALLQDHEDVVRLWCPIKHLSRLALVTCDEGGRELGGQSKLKEKMTRFAWRFKYEIMSGQFSEALTSPMLSMAYCYEEFLEVIRPSLDDLINRNDNDNIPFTFWSGASETVFSRIFTRLLRHSPLLAFMTCCYWGRARELELAISALTEAGAEEVAVAHNYTLFLSSFDQPNWSKVPFDSLDTPLITAAWRGHDRVVMRLLNLGCNVDTRGMTDNTVLMHFCARGNDVMVTELLRRGASATVKNAFYMTPLHFAVSRRPWALPHGLIEISDLQARNWLGETPLLAACRSGWSLDDLKRLCAAGVDPTLPDFSGMNCLHVASLAGRTGVLEWLRQAHPMKFRECVRVLVGLMVKKRRNAVLLERTLAILEEEEFWVDKERLLLDACIYSDDHTMAGLLNHVTSVCARNAALWQAARWGHIEAVRLTLARGADPDYKNEDENMTCLEAACRSFSPRCVELLLRWVKGRSKSPQQLNRLLFKALKHRRLRIAELLLTNRADLDARDETGFTSLHMAALSDSPKVLNWCWKRLRTSLDVDISEGLGATPLALACGSGRWMSLRWLADRGADLSVTRSNGNTLLHDAVLCSAVDIIRALLSLGHPHFHRNHPNDEGDTALMLAFAENCLEAVKVLGVDHVSILIENKKDQNCLTIACEHGSIKLIRYCLPHLPSRLETILPNGDTCLLAACRRNDEDFALRLLALGANPSAMGWDRKTGLDITEASGNRVLHFALVYYIRR